jgi:misacylated tRNA(Ala) deacylase
VETKPLYQTDAYLRSFESTVIVANGTAVALDATAFFPGGGGQPHDVGRLLAGERVWQVAKVWREGPLIRHKVEGEVPPVGAAVSG